MYEYMKNAQLVCKPFPIIKGPEPSFMDFYIIFFLRKSSHIPIGDLPRMFASEAHSNRTRSSIALGGEGGIQYTCIDIDLACRGTSSVISIDVPKWSKTSEWWVRWALGNFSIRIFSRSGYSSTGRTNQTRALGLVVPIGHWWSISRNTVRHSRVCRISCMQSMKTHRYYTSVHSPYCSTTFILHEWSGCLA